jgi:hypothetical protein
VKLSDRLASMTPPQSVSAAREDQQRALAAWHEEWNTEQIAAGVDGPVPPGRRSPSDYNLHVPDVAADPADEDEFHRRAREIMGLA